MSENAPGPPENGQNDPIVAGASATDAEKAENQPLDLLIARQVIWEGRLWPVLGKAEVDEDAYVRAELAITASQMKDGRLKEIADSKGRGRMERTEMYARWRYRGFLAGQIASL